MGSSSYCHSVCYLPPPVYFVPARSGVKGVWHRYPQGLAVIRDSHLLDEF